jgi:hypothetical protein
VIWLRREQWNGIHAGIADEAQYTAGRSTGIFATFHHDKKSVSMEISGGLESKSKNAFT